MRSVSQSSELHASFGTDNKKSIEKRKRVSRRLIVGKSLRTGNDKRQKQSDEVLKYQRWLKSILLHEGSQGRRNLRRGQATTRGRERTPETAFRLKRSP